MSIRNKESTEKGKTLNPTFSSSKKPKDDRFGHFQGLSELIDIPVMLFLIKCKQ